MARTTGPAPTPIEKKRARGNPGKRKLPDLASGEVVVLPNAEGNVPPPLRPLGQVGQQTWEYVWGQGATWLSPASDALQVQALCERVEERAHLWASVLRDGLAEERRALRQLDRAIDDALSALALTPTDRARYGLAEAVTANVLEQYQQRAAERRRRAWAQ